ncbi:hypothetical protein [Flavobacterium aquiphilum]|uniref:hypothetical protein n=1 Tax=Flavobacterium aquiphilum TaxID=3003261 RepID=UPI002480857F|nr:hypothetical protein [Flavobacterium aquiphilum]
MTLTEIRELIATKLADTSDIQASEHREVENAIVDYIEALQSTIAKSKVVTLDSWTTDRNYSVATGLSSGAVIAGVLVMLVCKNVNNGFSIGDTITAPTPYPEDSHRTSAQGIGVQFNNLNPATINVMVNDQITIMTVYNPAPSAIANNVIFSGSATNDWKIQLVIGYV